MHGYAYSHRNGITVIPPYSDGAYEYPRRNGKLAITRVYNAVQTMLDEIAEQSGGNVWWDGRKYTISITANHEIGTYVYRVNPIPTPPVNESDDPWTNTATAASGSEPF